MKISLEEWFDKNIKIFGVIEFFLKGANMSVEAPSRNKVADLFLRGHPDVFYSMVHRAPREDYYVYHLLWSETECFTLRLDLAGEDIFLKLFSELLYHTSDWGAVLLNDHHRVKLFACKDCNCYNDQLIGGPCRGKDERIVIYPGFFTGNL